MSAKKVKIISGLISLAAIVMSFFIVASDAVFGEASLSDIDFKSFYLVVIPYIAFLLVIILSNNEKSK